MDKDTPEEKIYTLFKKKKKKTELDKGKLILNLK